MRSLTLKIFVSYWIAAAIVIVVFNILGSPIHRPEYSRAMETLLSVTAEKVGNEYEMAGCGSMPTVADSGETSFYLTNSKGELLCGVSTNHSLSDLAAKATSSEGKFVRKRNINDEMFARAITTRSGTSYVLFLQEPYAQPGEILGVLTPSYTTIGISGVCTLLLAFILTRPIRRLRSAARQIASGKLETRVGSKRNRGTSKRLGGIDGLMQDFDYMADRLQSLVSSQRMLLRDVSHELRSPLARLSVALELARERPEAERAKHLDRIETEAFRINTMLGELLSLSQMDRIEAAARLEDISVNTLLLELCTDAAYEAQKTNRRVSCRLEENCSVLGDVSLLRRAFENVIRNAVHHCPQGSAITIDLAKESRGDVESILVRVSDSGPGVPEQELELILQPFYRANRSSGKTDGYGLGLSIAASAIRLHSGAIVAKNRAQGGLVVEMTIPSVESGS